MSTPEQVRSLADSLIEARERVKKLEKQWEELFSPNAPEKKRERKRQPNSLAGRIITLMQRNPLGSYDHAAVANELQESDVQKVRRSLDKLVFLGKIERRGRGLYGHISAKPQEAA